jgi:cytochrome c peroxidase
MDAPYDRWRRGDRTALTQPQQRGMALFFGSRLDCAACHAAPLFTDADDEVPVAAFHDIGLYDLDGRGAYPAGDHGLREITGRAEDEGRFRTPSLRNVALTAPYMHDGSVPTLAEAIRRHYARSDPLRDATLKGRVIPDGEIGDLVAFLGALTDPGFTHDPRFSLPKPACPI